jgi:hypothetical protein
MERNQFLAAISKVPRVGGTSRTNISEIVQKHVPAGMDLHRALSFLECSGFKVFPYTGKNVPLGQKWFLAEREEMHKAILAERTRVIIESDGDRVLKSRGWIFLIGI